MQRTFSTSQAQQLIDSARYEERGMDNIHDGLVADGHRICQPAKLPNKTRCEARRNEISFLIKKIDV